MPGRAGCIARFGPKVGQSLVPSLVVGRDFEQAFEGLAGAGEVSGPFEELPEAAPRRHGIRTPLRQHLEMQQGGRIAAAEQLGQRCVGLDVILVELQHPPPGRRRAGIVVHGDQTSAEGLPGCHRIGIRIGDGAQVDHRRGRIGVKQSSQGGMGLDVAAVELQEPPPGVDGLIPVSKRCQGLAKRAPDIRRLGPRLGQGAQMDHRLGRIGRQQLGQGAVGFQVVRRGGQHPPPGGHGGRLIAEGGQGAGERAPGLRRLRSFVGDRPQVDHGLGVIAFQQRGQRRVGFEILGIQGQHTPPGGAGLSGARQASQGATQAGPDGFVVAGDGHDAERLDRFRRPLGQQARQRLIGLEVAFDQLLNPPPRLDPELAFAGLYQRPSETAPARDVRLVDLDQALQARDRVAQAALFDQQAGGGVDGLAPHEGIQGGGLLEGRDRGVNVPGGAAAFAFGQRQPGPLTRIPLGRRHQRGSRRVPTPARAATGWARTMMPTILIRLG